MPTEAASINWSDLAKLVFLGLFWMVIANDASRFLGNEGFAWPPITEDDDPIDVDLYTCTLNNPKY